MAQQEIKMDEEKLCCSICLDFVKNPVTTSCGHNYCMDCIKGHWDGEDERGMYSCPQCRQMFTPRPALRKNTMLADLVEDLKKRGHHDAPADHCYAGPEDVSCDVCTGRKLKAVQSCLQCLVSYCEQHLQPHFESPAFERHTLVEPSKKLQENICPRHKEVMKIFCRTDQQCICFLCSMDEHKDHNIVSAEAEHTERQKEFKVSQKKIHQIIQDREKDVKVLQQEVEMINCSADKAVRDSEKTFTDLIRLLEKRRSDVKQQIRSQQKSEVSRVKELQQKLEQEITDLRQKHTEVERLSLTENHTQFLQHYLSLSCLSGSSDSPSIKTRPVRHFEDVMAAVSQATDKIQDILGEEWTKISRAVTEVDVLLPQAEPKTRAEFLQYSQQITLDADTAGLMLQLSEGSRTATVNGILTMKMSLMNVLGDLTDSPTVHRLQVLSRESLTGRAYFEVEWTGYGIAVAVTSDKTTEYKNGFGNNDTSWALYCSTQDIYYKHNNIRTDIKASPSSKVGVYVDHSAGILSFYRVSDTMTLLHRVQTTFTQPLYAGLWVLGRRATVSLI